nr:oestradiol-receptor=P1 peptide [swine, Peptide, 10 aa] [Sus scrofa]
ELVHMINWAK